MEQEGWMMEGYTEFTASTGNSFEVIDGRLIEFEFSLETDELYAYGVAHDSDGVAHRRLVASGEDAYRLKYGRWYV